MLFHRVILMSGSALSPWAVVRNPRQTTLQVASAFNCSLSNSWSRGSDDLVVGSSSGNFGKYNIPLSFNQINIWKSHKNSVLYIVREVLHFLIALSFPYKGGHSRTLLQCLRSVPLHRLMRIRPDSGSPFRPAWGPSYDGVVVHSFRHRMRDYLERMARYIFWYWGIICKS